MNAHNLPRPLNEPPTLNRQSVSDRNPQEVAHSNNEYNTYVVPTRASIGESGGYESPEDMNEDVVSERQIQPVQSWGRQNQNTNANLQSPFRHSGATRGQNSPPDLGRAALNDSALAQQHTAPMGVNRVSSSPVLNELNLHNQQEPSSLLPLREDDNAQIEINKMSESNS